MRHIAVILMIAGTGCLLWAATAGGQSALDQHAPHETSPKLPWMAHTAPSRSAIPHCGIWHRDGYESLQVNVDAFGCNIVGDAANEPSLAVSSADPRKIVIGWRQFDSIASDFRQAGYGYSHDAGHSWVFPGALTPGVFGSDPVLASGPMERTYYLSISFQEMRLFRTWDAGLTWLPRVQVRQGFVDKPWMTIDLTGGPGHGHVYIDAEGVLYRSTDGGVGFTLSEGGPSWSGLTVHPSGELFVFGGYIAKSVNAQFAAIPPTMSELPDPPLCPARDPSTPAEIQIGPSSPNPGGVLDQRWVAADHSDGPRRGFLYVLRVESCGDADPKDIMFNYSMDGGYTWDEPIRVNDNPLDSGAWQWFPAMSVAPNGRIDVVWNDTRNSGQTNLSELFYSFSEDGGLTWAPNIPVSPMFDSWVGWPGGNNKLGDYYHTASDNLGVNVAYAATFNGEQDVYFLRIGPWDCNGNEVDDAQDIAGAHSTDCNTNDVPDECEYRVDVGGDGLTTLSDHSNLAQKLAGPAGPPPAGCDVLFDADHNGHIDLTDFAYLQRVFVTP